MTDQTAAVHLTASLLREVREAREQGQREGWDLAVKHARRVWFPASSMKQRSQDFADLMDAQRLRNWPPVKEGV